MRSRYCGLVSLLGFGLACGDDAGVGAGGTTSQSTGQATPAANTTNTAASTASASASSTASSGTGGPTTIAACANPVVTEVGSFNAAAGKRFASLTMDHEGSISVLGYAEGSADGWEAKLLDFASSSVPGNHQPIGTPPASPLPPRLSVATDGAFTMAVLAISDTQFVLRSFGGVLGMFGGNGQNPSLAFGHNKFALIHGEAGALVSWRVTPTDGLDGTSKKTILQGAGPFDPVLTSTLAGFASIERDAVGILHRYDAEFLEDEGNTVLGYPDLPLKVAATGSSVAATYISQGAPTLRIASQASTLAPPIKVDDAAAASVYQHLALAGAYESLGVVWSAFEGNIDYRAFAEDGTPLGPVVHLAPASWNDNPVAITTIPTGFLVAAAVGLAQDRIVILKLDC